MTKQYKKDYFEDRKLKYEKNHGVFIHEFMFTEFSNRILGQCNVALNDLQKQLDLEIARAKAEEKRLDSKIDAINNLYMVNNAESYELNEHGSLVKSENKTKLITNYNDTLMLIVSCLNALKLNLEKLTERVTALENK